MQSPTSCTCVLAKNTPGRDYIYISTNSVDFSRKGVSSCWIILIIHSFYPTQGPISGKTCLPFTETAELSFLDVSLTRRISCLRDGSKMALLNAYLKKRPDLFDFEVTNDGQSFTKAKTGFILLIN